MIGIKSHILFKAEISSYCCQQIFWKNERQIYLKNKYFIQRVGKKIQLIPVGSSSFNQSVQWYSVSFPLLQEITS